MWIPRKVWAAVEAELIAGREDVRKAYERIDRLVEALAHKQNLPIVMPQAELPKFQAAPAPLERIPGWFDNKPRPKAEPTGAKP